MMPLRLSQNLSNGTTFCRQRVVASMNVSNLLRKSFLIARRWLVDMAFHHKGMTVEESTEVKLVKDGRSTEFTCDLNVRLLA